MNANNWLNWKNIASQLFHLYFVTEIIEQYQLPSTNSYYILWFFSTKHILNCLFMYSLFQILIFHFSELNIVTYFYINPRISVLRLDFTTRKCETVSQNSFIKTKTSDKISRNVSGKFILPFIHHREVFVATTNSVKEMSMEIHSFANNIRLYYTLTTSWRRVSIKRNWKCEFRFVIVITIVIIICASRKHNLSMPIPQ